MKISRTAIAVAITTVTAASVTLSTATAEDCDIRAIKPLFKDNNVVICNDDSGFSLIPSSSSPGKLPAERIRKMCASKACTKMLTTLKGLGLGDCALLGIKLETDLLNPVQAVCESESSASGSTSTTGSKAAEIAASVESSSVVTTKPPPVDADSLDNIVIPDTFSSPSTSSLTKTPATSFASKTPAPTPSSATASPSAIFASVAAVAIVGVAIVQFFL